MNPPDVLGLVRVSFDLVQVDAPPGWEWAPWDGRGVAPRRVRKFSRDAAAQAHAEAVRLALVEFLSLGRPIPRGLRLPRLRKVAPCLPS